MVVLVVVGGWGRGWGGGMQKQTRRCPPTHLAQMSRPGCTACETHCTALHRTASHAPVILNARKTYPHRTQQWNQAGDEALRLRTTVEGPQVAHQPEGEVAQAAGAPGGVAWTGAGEGVGEGRCHARRRREGDARQPAHSCRCPLPTPGPSHPPPHIHHTRPPSSTYYPTRHPPTPAHTHAPAPHPRASS